MITPAQREIILQMENNNVGIREIRAQQQYRQTEKGRKSHRDAEKRRKNRKKQKTLEFVDDEGSTAPVSDVILPSRPFKSIGLCHCCGIAGVIVRNFPRRAYGR